MYISFSHCFWGVLDHQIFDSEKRLGNLTDCLSLLNTAFELFSHISVC